MNQWEDQISSLLDETQALVSSVEAAVIDGLTGSYVSRISMALNNVEENLESCPILNDLADQVERIKEFFMIDAFITMAYYLAHWEWMSGLDQN